MNLTVESVTFVTPVFKRKGLNVWVGSLMSFGKLTSLGPFSIDGAV